MTWKFRLTTMMAQVRINIFLFLIIARAEREREREREGETESLHIYADLCFIVLYERGLY